MGIHGLLNPKPPAFRCELRSKMTIPGMSVIPPAASPAPSIKLLGLGPIGCVRMLLSPFKRIFVPCVNEDKHLPSLSQPI